MLLGSTGRLQDVLRRASAQASSGQEDPFLKHVAAANVPWAVLKDAKVALESAGELCDLQAACKGSHLMLTAPVAREVCPALRSRLDAIKANNDQLEYDSLVTDVSGRKAPGTGDTFLPTTKLQLGMGAHVGVTMLLGFSLGTAAGSAFESYSPAIKYLGGVLGLMIALVFETFLFMARSTMADSADMGKKYLHLTDPVRHAQLQEGSTPDLSQTFETAPRSVTLTQAVAAKPRAAGKRASKKRQ